MSNETYLGDGLYASFDGCQIILRAPRENGDHFVALEPEVLEAFDRFVGELRANRDEAAYERQQEKLMEDGPDTSIQERQDQELRDAGRGHLVRP